MENYWGFQWIHHNGIIYNTDLGFRVKLTYGLEDGSSTNGYNSDGSNYVNTGITIPNTQNYISEMKFTEVGMFPKAQNGSSSSYYCDYLLSQSAGIGSGNSFGQFGARNGQDSWAGAFSINLSEAIDGTFWGISAKISCKPLEEDE